MGNMYFYSSECWRALGPSSCVMWPVMPYIAKVSLILAFQNIGFQNALWNSYHLFWNTSSVKASEEWQFHLSLIWEFWAHSEQKLRECLDTAKQSKYLHNPGDPGAPSLKQIHCAAASSWHLYVSGRNKQVGPAVCVPSAAFLPAPVLTHRGVEVVQGPGPSQLLVETCSGSRLCLYQGIKEQALAP